MQSGTEVAKWYLFSTEMCMWTRVPYLFVNITVANTNYLLQGCPGAPQLPCSWLGAVTGPGTEGSTDPCGLDIFFFSDFLATIQKGMAGM